MPHFAEITYLSLETILFVIFLTAVIGILILYGYIRFKIAKEWEENDQERIKRIQETGKYELPEKGYW